VEKSSDKKIWIILGVVALVVLYNSFFIVPQTEQAVVLEFGKPVTFVDNDKEVRFISSPGLKIKVPFIQEVKYFDNRILNFEATDKEVLDVEKKALTVNAFAKYKIVEPLRFYEKVTDIRGINTSLDKIFEASLRDAIGMVPLSKLLTGARKDVIGSLKSDVSKKAKDFGIEILDVRIVRADLPKENSNAIYKRMYAERNKEAREYRAQGEEEAKILQSKADKEVTVILAEAERQAQVARGEGDAKSIKIFGQAFGKDKEFYQFYRTMEAYRKSVKSENTKMVLSPDSDFLKYFKEMYGKKK
jgi:membrane protease subunit HflC